MDRTFLFIILIVVCLAVGWFARFTVVPASNITVKTEYYKRYRTWIMQYALDPVHLSGIKVDSFIFVESDTSRWAHAGDSYWFLSDGSVDSTPNVRAW